MNFKSFARQDNDTAELRFRKLLILIIALACSVCGILWSLLYFFVFGAGLTAFLPFSFTIIVGSTVIVSHYLHNYKILVYVQLVSITWISAFLQWSIGNIDQSGFVIAWSFLGPIGALIFLPLRQAIFWMLMFVAIVVATVAFEPSLTGQIHTVSNGIRTLFYIMNIGTASTLVFAVSAWFANNVQNEKERSDNLLLNILPEEVAEELKAKGSSDAKMINHATVLFTDFKEFTALSEKMSPTELVAEINECFSIFDTITEKYNIEKIKTIGDSYMAAGGLPTPNETHPEDIVRAALEIQEYMQKHKQERKANGRLYFEVRIGIHTGPVVAGIVGVKKFQYDIWGDTVNTASRMESSGEAGKVNISGATYELVKDKFTCTHRGKIEAKGKGEVDMYFVEGLK